MTTDDMGLEAPASTQQQQQALATAMRRLQELEARKRGLEAQFQGHMGALGAVGMDTPLTDAEGFPRCDIDVYQVRHDRQAVIRLRNDYRVLMDELEGVVAQVFALRKALGPEEHGAASASSQDVYANMHPFATISAVLPDSPAAASGLVVGDRVLSFGPVSATTPNPFGALPQAVSGSVNKPMKVVVSRHVGGAGSGAMGGEGEVHVLYLTPRTWAGRGLLGCVLLPAQA